MFKVVVYSKVEIGDDKFYSSPDYHHKEKRSNINVTGINKNGKTEIWTAEMRLIFSCTSNQSTYLLCLVRWFQKLKTKRGIPILVSTNNYDVLSLTDNVLHQAHLIPIFQDDSEIGAQKYILNPCVC